MLTQSDSDSRSFRPIPFRDGSAPSAHLVGICGAGMKALSEVLVGLGWSITGSDLEAPAVPAALQRRGMRIHRGHHQHFLPRGADLVIHSPAVTAENPEIAYARQLAIPVFSYSQMLGHLMRGRTGISIAGTHGKSTTTAMVATILDDAGLQPTAVIGAELAGRSQSGWAGPGDAIVVESCEYKRSFLDLHPKIAAILNVEPDHFDCYPALADTVNAFRDFASQVDSAGMLVVPADDASTKDLITSASADYATFSFKPGANWWATDIRASGGNSRFRVFHDGKFFAEINLQVPGRHNVMNALAATAVSHYAGVKANEIRDALRDFAGIRRRFERIGSWKGITIIDDFAHHPTAVRMTLAAAREEFGQRRLIVAFQPHQASRTESLMDDFAESFCVADQVIVVPAFAARESPSRKPEESSQELARRMGEFNSDVTYVESLDRLMATIEDAARPGDVLITMGAGDIDRVHHEFHRRFQRHNASR